MHSDFVFYGLIAAAFIAAYLIGRRHGRQAEQSNPSVGVVGPWRPK
jgi:hypothetical protein